MAPDNGIQGIVSIGVKSLSTAMEQLPLRFKRLHPGEDPPAHARRALQTALAAIPQGICRLSGSRILRSAVRSSLPTLFVQRTDRDKDDYAPLGKASHQRRVDPVKKYQFGGLVGGHSPHDRADNIPALLTAGEFVEPVRAVQYYGLKVLEGLRRISIPRQVVHQWLHAVPGLTAEARTGLQEIRGFEPSILSEGMQNVQDRLYRYEQKLAHGGLVREMDHPSGQNVLDMGTVITPYRQTAAWSSPGQNYSDAGQSTEPRDKAAEQQTGTAMNDDWFAAQLERILERTRKKRLQ